MLKKPPIIVLTVMFIANLLVLNMFYNLNNDCTCSQDTRRTFVQIYLVCSSTFLAILISLYYLKHTAIVVQLLKIYSLPIIIGSIIYVVCTIQYAQKLKKNKCECARNIVNIVLKVLSPLLSISNIIIVVIIMSGFGYFMQKHR